MVSDGSSAKAKLMDLGNGHNLMVKIHTILQHKWHPLAIMTATTYPSLAPYEYSASTVPGYGFPAYGSQYFMYGAPMTTGVG